MKTSANTCNFIYLVFILLLWFQVKSVHAQDIEQLSQRFSAYIEKIEAEEQANQFFWTHVKSEYGLTENILQFLVDLNGGAYTEQVDFLMTVPVQKWNPNIGYGGWGAYEIENVKKLVGKNQYTAFNNVSNYASKISKGLKYYSLCSSIIKAIQGDDAARLKSLHTTFEIVRGWMTAEFPNINVAMLSVGIINYALDKFISTTLDDYNEYWWNQYSLYLSKKYPGFVNDWALPSAEGDHGAFLERRFSEFWESADQFEQNAPVFHRSSLYAMNQFGPSFAARYYKDYLHESFKTWARRNAEQEEANAWREFRNSSRELNELIEEIKILMALIEEAERLMKEKMPVSLAVIPNEAKLDAGGTLTFKGLAVFEDETYTDITTLETASWSPGSNTFIAPEETEATMHYVTVRYMNLEATATITVMGKETDKDKLCGDNEEWSDSENRCVCIAGFERIEELDNKCVNLDKAIEDIAGEKPDAICDEASMALRFGRLRSIVAESNFKAAQFRNFLDQFMKAVNEKSGFPCNNQIVAAAYAGARHISQDIENHETEFNELSRELVLEAAICQLNNPDYEWSSIYAMTRQFASPRNQVINGIASMESQLKVFGCDQQDVADLGDKIADRTADPEVISGMGTPGDGPLPPGPTDGATGAIAAVYSGTNAPLSSVTVRVSLPFRTFNFSLAKDYHDTQHFQNAQLKEGDRMQITVQGTPLNASITLLPSDFAWIDPGTQQVTSPGKGYKYITVVIAVYFDDDEDVNRYGMIVGIGTLGMGIPGFPDGFGRELRF
jgi:hypothetical protein